MPDPVAEQELVIIQGEDSTAIPYLEIQNEDLSAFNLTGWTLTCQFRKQPGGGVALEPDVTVVGSASAGIVKLVYTSAQSFGLSGQLRYDIFGTHATSGQRRLCEGPVRLSLAITRP